MGALLTSFFPSVLFLFLSYPKKTKKIRNILEEQELNPGLLALQATVLSTRKTIGWFVWKTHLPDMEGRWPPTTAAQVHSELCSSEIHHSTTGLLCYSWSSLFREKPRSCSIFSCSKASLAFGDKSFFLVLQCSHFPRHSASPLTRWYICSDSIWSTHLCAFTCFRPLWMAALHYEPDI